MALIFCPVWPNHILRMRSEEWRISACAIATGPLLKIWATVTHVQIYVITHDENPSIAPRDTLTLKFGKLTSITLIKVIIAEKLMPGVGESKLQP